MCTNQHIFTFGRASEISSSSSGSTDAARLRDIVERRAQNRKMNFDPSDKEMCSSIHWACILSTCMHINVHIYAINHYKISNFAEAHSSVLILPTTFVASVEYAHMTSREQTV